MNRIAFALAVALAAVAPSTLHAEGLLYRVPDDGTWVKFEIEGNAEVPDGTPVTLKGTVTLSSVGTEVVNGKRYRWIELHLHAKRNGEVFTDIDKLLVPEQQLAPGKDPLEGVQKIWHLHSQVPSGPFEVKGNDERVQRHLKKIRPFLHGPFERPEKLENLAVECKLGNIDCPGVKASETFKMGGGLYNVDYTIRLHETAPTGVAAWQSEMRFKFNGESGSMTTKLKLIDFGKDAKSAIPDAK